jgi:hypothetical protein
MDCPVREIARPTASPRFEFADGNNGFASNTLRCVPGDSAALREKERFMAHLGGALTVAAKVKIIWVD